MSDSYDRGENVCVIGAGASGLLAVKNLLELGFTVDCYERETGVGGLWNWRHDRSPVTATTHLISSRATSGIPDFPMPDSWPDYPDHRQVHSYLERYADHFDLRRHIWFGTEVVRVRPLPGDPLGRWQVTTRSTGGGTERTHQYGAVVVANGHHWSPVRPDYEGMDRFTGEVLLAGAVKDPTILRDRRVLVIGGGNTGADLAVEAAQRAAACWHSTRRGYWYVPKYLLGRPIDQLNQQLVGLRLPTRVRQWLTQRTLRLTVGDLTRFGLPAPDHRIGQSHPIVNSQLPYLLGHGRLTPVPDVARFHADEVELVDGRRIAPDLVVLATGYQPRFDFLEQTVLDPDPAGRPQLSLHMFTRHPTLAMAGLVQADTGVFGLVHWQTVVFARWLRLRQVSPGRSAGFWSWVDSQRGRRLHDTRLLDSPRHWFEVSRDRYLRMLERALAQLEVDR
ncbi:MAG TPA: NAD(P)-binding domain-containing protein [Natronosporangium sp.]|nr:NAD(P)-binding domain-containing protein [Natronosporangium sp.]